MPRRQSGTARRILWSMGMVAAVWMEPGLARGTERAARPGAEPTGRSARVASASVGKRESAAKSPKWGADHAAGKGVEARDASSKARPKVDLKDSAAVAALVDRMIVENLSESQTQPAPRASDGDFLRRATFDLAGTTPLPRDVTLFGLDTDPQKRLKVIERLLGSEDYSHNWAEYWRDVIYLRATEMRARGQQAVFETWMAGQLRENQGWDKITTSLLTATGAVNEHGETALVYAQGGQPAEVAAEVSRIFLGIQIQCANCHDHPSDKWKRQQFHQLAAFFPRVTVKRKKGDVRSFEVVSLEEGTGAGRRGGLLDNPERVFARLDRNHDGKITLAEVKNLPAAKQFEKIIANADANKDNAVTLAELKKMPLPQGAKRATAEYYMPDLKDPSSRGTKVEPVFFVDGKRPRAGLPDDARRRALARYVTSPTNRWFARAYVNRIWAEMLGDAFYTPIDDMGPQRQARMPEVLDLLADAFVANRYDMKWLFLTIARSETYQRQIRAKDPSVETPPVFAASAPKRLRADQLFNAITKVLGIEGAEPKETDAPPAGGKRPPRSPRAQFAFLFGYDPSTSQDELIGNVPQALFMMNSRLINGLIRAEGRTRLANILRDYKDDQDALKEVYVLALAREPSAKELAICLEYVHQVDSRHEAFEDVLWSLLNSSEFLSKR